MVYRRDIKYLDFLEFHKIIGYNWKKKLQFNKISLNLCNFAVYKYKEKMKKICLL